MYLKYTFYRKERWLIALSGVITGSTNNSRYSLTCEWSATQNTSANTSTITAKVYLTPPSGWNTISSYWCCTINGTQVTTNMSANISSKTLLGSRTWTVSHNSDGTASVSISFSFSNRVTAGTYTVSSGSGSGTATLNTIARGSSFTLNKSSAELGKDSITLSITRSSSSYKHKIQFYFGSHSALLAENVDTSYTFTPALSLSAQIPSATSGTATIKVQTMNGSTWIAETSRTITLKVPSTVTPTVGISITTNNPSGWSSVPIAGKTTFTVKPTNASGVQGSTISSYSTSGTGLSTTSSSGGTTSTVSSGTHTYTVKVTDTRGRTGSASQSVTVYNYSSPTVSFTPYRANSSGNKQAEGTYVYTTFNYEISNPNNANANIKQYRTLKKTASSSTWTEVTGWTNLSSYSGSLKVSFGGGFNATVSYDVKIEVKDSFSTTTLSKDVGTMEAVLNIEKSGVGIGKIWERGALDVGGEMHVSKNVYVGNRDNNGDGLKSGYYISNPDEDLCVAVQASHGGIDLGSSARHTAICSNDAPGWWNGSKQYKIYTEGNKPTASDVGAIASTGNTTGNPRVVGSLGIVYANNTQASAYLCCINGIFSIRYEGTGTGSTGGFQIVGAGDDVKFKIDNAGMMWATSLRFWNSIGQNYFTTGTGDGDSYSTYNIKLHLHYGLGIADNGDSIRMVIQSRSGRIMGQQAYYVNSSRKLKSDIRNVLSEHQPRSLQANDDIIDTNLTEEKICDFLDSINIKTYITDADQNGVTQADVDHSKGNNLVLGYVADELEHHEVYKYIGEKTEDGLHAINTHAFTVAVLVGYQNEKRKSKQMAERIELLEQRLNKVLGEEEIE